MTAGFGDLSLLQKDTLSGKDRVRKALKHQEGDRVPIWELGFHNEVARRITGRDILLPTGGGKTMLAVLQANANGSSDRQKIITRIVNDTMTFYDYMGFNMVRIRPTDFLNPVAFGSGNWSPNALLDVKILQESEFTWKVEHISGHWSQHVYSGESETLADSNDSIKEGGLEALKHYVELLESQPIDLGKPQLKDALGGIQQTVDHPLSKDIFVLGWADVCYPGSTAHVAVFLEAMALEPEYILRYMEVTTDGILALMQAQADLGIDGFTGGNDWAFKSGPMFSVRHLRKLIAPSLKRIVDEAHRLKLPYIKHIDGDIRKHLPVLVDEIGIDGLHAIEPDCDMDIFKLKNQYRNRLTLLGNLECDLLARGHPDEIRAEVKKLMTYVAPGGGYVFSTSNSVLMNVPKENLVSMINTARKYGCYPN